MVSAWRKFKNIFSRPLFTIIFRPETLKCHQYSILTGQTMVRFVIYCVLSSSVLRIVKLINACYFVASSLHTIGAQWKIGTLNFLVCWAWIIECFKSKTTCPPAAARFCLCLRRLREPQMAGKGLRFKSSPSDQILSLKCFFLLLISNSHWF